MTPIFNVLTAKFQAFNAFVPNRFPLTSLHSYSLTTTLSDTRVPTGRSR